MRILIVTRGVPTADRPLRGIFELDQARALAAAGHEVMIASLDFLWLDRAQKRPFSIDGVTVYPCSRPMGYLIKKGLHLLRRPSRKKDAQTFATLYPDAVPKKYLDAMQASALKKLYPRIRRDKGAPDVVHAHFLEQAAAASALCEREHLPLVVTEHLSLLNRPDVPPAIRQRAVYAYRGADRLLAVSAPFVAALHRLTQYPVSLVPNIADVSVFCGSPIPRSKTEPFRFVSCGILIERKAFDRLLDAFAAMHAAVPDTTLTICGDGGSRGALQQQIDRLGLAGSVIMAGHCSRQRLAEIYHTADAFVLASRLETFGVVYIEAMAAGLPVIATRCGGPEDFVTGETGLLVPVDDTPALTAAMLDMRRNAARYDRARIAAYVADRFSPQAVAAALTEIYEDVLDGYRLPPPPVPETGEPLVSIILPVYNTERYLEACLDSLLGQTYRNLEILAVDDGSSDGSGAILDRYAQQDARLRVFHQKNGGVSAARNLALGHMAGEYVGFIDSDDFAAPDMYETLMTTALKTRADIVECSYYLRYSDGLDVPYRLAAQTLQSRADCLREYMRTRNTANVLWNKLFRCEILAGAVFPPTYCGEDYVYNVQAHRACRRKVVLAYCCYHYRQRDDSCCGGPFSVRRMDSMRSATITEAMVPPRDFRFIARWQAEYAMRHYWAIETSDLAGKTELLATVRNCFHTYYPRICGLAMRDLWRSKWFLPAQVFRIHPRLFVLALRILNRLGLKH